MEFEEDSQSEFKSVEEYSTATPETELTDKDTESEYEEVDPSSIVEDEFVAEDEDEEEDENNLNRFCNFDINSLLQGEQQQ